MCFFVLLLSFSELDVLKFKQIAGSMKYAFGVQNQIQVQDIPKGTSVIAQEFSPGKPEDTPINRIEQITFDANRSSTEETEASKEESKRNENEKNDRKYREIILAEERIIQDFQQELNSGQFELDNQGQQLVIRIQENGAFASGSGFLQPQLKPALRKLNSILLEIPGQKIVAGHTDNRPLRNEIFQDNLELSSARALAVARVLNHNGALKNLSIQGMGDTAPLADNDTDSGRSRNRRVEITIAQGSAKFAELPALVE
jgi:chemotaxis protein MotB